MSAFTERTNPQAEVPLPPGAHTLSTWADWDDLYRIVWGESRRVEGTQIVLSPCAPQLPDGSIEISGALSDEVTAIMIDEIRDGATCDCLSVTVAGARNLAQALTAAADEIDGWAGR
jgi:hypothetical protein